MRPEWLVGAALCCIVFQLASCTAPIEDTRALGLAQAALEWEPPPEGPLDFVAEVTRLTTEAGTRTIAWQSDSISDLFPQRRPLATSLSVSSHTLAVSVHTPNASASALIFRAGGTSPLYSVSCTSSTANHNCGALQTVLLPWGDGPYEWELVLTSSDPNASIWASANLSYLEDTPFEVTTAAHCEIRDSVSEDESPKSIGVCIPEPTLQYGGTIVSERFEVRSNRARVELVFDNGRSSSEDEPSEITAEWLWGGPFRAGAWTSLSGQYSEDQSGAPWGLFALGGESLVHFRTDDSGATPRAIAKLRPYRAQPDGTFVAGAWTELAGNYSEDRNGAPWGLFGLGADSVVHWRTDNAGSTPRAKVKFREYRPDGAEEFAPGAWTELSGNYSEDLRGAPWGLFPLGEDSIVHFRTDNVGSTPQAKAKFRVYRRQADGRFLPGDFTELEGSYSEDRKGAPWGLFALGQDAVVHWRTDNQGSEPQAVLKLRVYREQPDGTMSPGPWTILESYREHARAPFGLAALGDDSILHFRTDDWDSNGQAEALIRAYRPAADGTFSAEEPSTLDRYREHAGAPWGLIPLDGRAIVHWRTNNDGPTPNADLIVRTVFDVSDE